MLGSGPNGTHPHAAAPVAAALPATAVAGCRSRFVDGPLPEGAAAAAASLAIALHAPPPEAENPFLREIRASGAQAEAAAEALQQHFSGGGGLAEAEALPAAAEAAEAEVLATPAAQMVMGVPSYLRNLRVQQQERLEAAESPVAESSSSPTSTSSSLLRHHILMHYQVCARTCSKCVYVGGSAPQACRPAQSLHDHSLRTMLATLVGHAPPATVNRPPTLSTNANTFVRIIRPNPPAPTLPCASLLQHPSPFCTNTTM